MRKGICINWPICSHSSECEKCNERKKCCKEYPGYIPQAPCPICGHDFCICNKENK